MMKLWVIGVVVLLSSISFAAAVKVSDMPQATVVTSVDLVNIVQGGVNKKANTAQLTDALSAVDILNKVKSVDGVGSGLDADTLGGMYPAAYATAAQGILATNAEPFVSPGTTAQYRRGDKTWATTPTTLPASDVYTWAKSATKPSYTKSEVGLSSVDNTADTAKPVSTAQQTALNLKANLASPTFTGTVGGVTKSMVGLSSVDNTADMAKPVSTAQQTALNLKANLASPIFTGTVGGITKSMVGLPLADNTADSSKTVLAAAALTGRNWVEIYNTSVSIPSGPASAAQIALEPQINEVTYTYNVQTSSVPVIQSFAPTGSSSGGAVWVETVPGGTDKLHIENMSGVTKIFYYRVWAWK